MLQFILIFERVFCDSDERILFACDHHAKPEKEQVSLFVDFNLAEEHPGNKN